MQNDALFRWFPVATAIIQIIFLPIIMVALNAQIDGRVQRHNDNLYAHPALNDLKQLESKIEMLSNNVLELKIAIARLANGHAKEEEY